MKTILLFLALVSFSGIGCSNKQPDWTVEVPKEGTSHYMKCWSGGVVIYEGNSIGRITREPNHVWFTDKADGMRKSISGDCIIESTTW